MPAVVAPAAERPSLKPSRSMTYPLREPKANTRRKVKQGEPFDAEELSRRLTAYLLEQRKKAERHREARAVKATTQQNSVYHHVPTVAAAAFERTTTPDVMRQIHKLSQPAVKTHLETFHVEDSLSGYGVTSLRKTQAIDQAILERDLLRTRNQFQWNHDMEDTVEVDIDRDIYKPPQRTFQTEASQLKSNHAPKASRPLSTGDIFSDEEDSPVPNKPKARPVHDTRDRNDWAQRDDDVDSRHNRRDWSGPFLRKRESTWIMRIKREKSIRQDKGGAVTADPESPPDKSGRGRFLARFKRHPS
ncbi:hypothetical protein BGZ60DRAFT_522159 [Tricladium varicosporioides]|nr:hypothetical protein BGZ60DRAFT_522159 [Hymenoscyphus varicosporioides]